MYVAVKHHSITCT